MAAPPVLASRGQRSRIIRGRMLAAVTAAMPVAPRNIASGPKALEAKPATSGPTTLPTATASRASVKLSDGMEGNSSSDQNAITALIIIT